MPKRDIFVVYHEQYLNYDFGEDHPFIPWRAKNFLEKLRKTKLNYQIITPQRAKDEDILLVHTQDYLHRVKELARTNGYLSLDTPVSEKNLEAAYWYTGGTITALNLALEGRFAFNTLGGLHHAGISDASGFCIFNDHAIAIRKLQKEGKIRRVAILDLDVHAGNGTQEIFYRDPNVLKISLHQDPLTLYPGTGFADQRGEGLGQGFNHNFPLPPGTGENEYLKTLDRAMPLVEKYKPDLLIVILGVDNYREDPLAQLQLNESTYQKIAERVRHYKNLAVLCAGGYHKKVPDLWLSFLDGLVL